MRRPLCIAICGLGTVARGVLELLRNNADIITERAGRPIRVLHVVSRNEKPGVDLLGAGFSTDLESVVLDPEVDLVVELIGGEDDADALVRRALEAGKHVVTANKAIIAKHGDAYLRQALEARVALGFEAAVAGGIPIISALTRGLSANRIHSLAGIINGTSNYILTAMADSGQTFAAALHDAKALGYAEADPTFDIEGIDAAHKLTIMAALAFGLGFRFDQVFTEGIDSVTSEDIEYARQLGYRIKHLGIARLVPQGVELRVHPTLVPEAHLLASVDGVMNAVMVEADAAGDTIYYGAGAGAGPTASAVVADIVDIAKGTATAWLPAAAEDSPLRVVPMGDIRAAYYLNIPSLDKPGVFARVATVLSEHQISIEAVIQKEQAVQLKADQAWVPIVILTHEVSEGAMHQAILALEESKDVIGPIKLLRVEHFSDD